VTAALGDIAILDTLLKLEAKVDVPDTEKGETPLHWVP
jgi:hypothetical protein